MTLDLVDAFGLGSRELVAFIGGGGKTSLLLELSRQLAAQGDRVLITTTTKLGLDQTEGTEVCWSIDWYEIESALDRGRPVFVLSEGDDHKVLGYDPETVGELYADSSAGYVLVEADGSRGRSLKAPDAHEPVVPQAASVVVVVMGVDAIGRTIFEASHRPARTAQLTGRAEADLITPEVAATVLTDPDGGLKGIPSPARVIVAITKVTEATAAAAAGIEALVQTSARVDRVVTIPYDPAFAMSG
jgi:probable selenium-dependent hydroxylase accessory protein YqeC